MVQVDLSTHGNTNAPKKTDGANAAKGRGVTPHKRRIAPLNATLLLLKE